MISAVLAIYGALLSTMLAFIQIGNFQRSRRYLEITIGRSFNTTDENVEFKISNRSNNKTEVQNIMIGICEMSNDGFVRLFAAHGFESFKTSHFWDKRETPLELPFALNPGESVYVDFSSTDANSFISRDRSYLPESVILGNAFELEIEHSQGNPRRAYFSMDPRKLIAEEELKEADSLSLWRSHIWKFDRSRL
ncbi:hypothetical protein EOC93_10940 [Mesorhizobium sp. M6A.T.Ce.TU.002.03.1.1]|uniref:hypothetical protein n=1 Tax=Mesorhizobium sp. M6A.T.Ce.TU.002.03.1.1 TaxID=2496782 RepID=UPI000FCA767F|nr:hypothetical protein [Mesorhizobium sp. M6A.T.Ce.TU.002.03.1.1]RUU44522.1 hypothetical protein EOC93_10940 [Mesorhizobium sp. M6A.T.Ce.TU.002.03.1.1]